MRSGEEILPGRFVIVSMSNLFISTYLASARQDLCERLSRDYGFKVFHYYPEIATKDALAWEKEYSFRNNPLEVSSLFGKYYARHLEELVGIEHPRLVIIQEFSLIAIQLLQLRKKYGFKLFSMCDDSMNMIGGNDFSWTHTLARKILPRFLDDIILNSPETAAWYREHFGKGEVLPIIPDEKVFRRRLKAASVRVPALRERISPDGRKIILFVGRAVALKNIPTLMRACVPLKNQARLVIVGSGEKLDELKSLDLQLGLGAYFAGECFGEELMGYYQLADVFCLPSTQEAFGSVVGEALMAGCPVAVSSHCGARALVNGDNGAVFEPLDVSALSTVLALLLERVQYREDVVLRDSLCPLSFSDCFNAIFLEEPSR